MKQGYVYIFSSGKNGTLYVGVTSNLIKRAYEHREGLVDGFTKKYNVKFLVWYEVHSSIGSAIYREKQIKHWTRNRKLALIEQFNPDWKDLYEVITK